MTQAEFNTKYNDYIEKGFTGMKFKQLGYDDVVREADGIFADLVKIPGFILYEIKEVLKHTRVRTNLSFETNAAIEARLDNVIRNCTDKHLQILQEAENS